MRFEEFITPKIEAISMKKIFAVLAAAAMIAVSCENTQEGSEPSITVAPTELGFDAEGAAPQTVTVTAVGVEWEHEVPANVSDWLTVSRDGDELAFSVADNVKGESRTAIVAVKALNNDDLRDRSVTVVQKANDNPVVYSLKVDPVYLEFDGVGASAQEVTVTVTGDMTWTADKGDADWITVTPGEGKLTVAVSDNESEDSREGMITVTPSDSEVEPETIRVVQGGLVKFDVDETELTFAFHNVDNLKSIAVDAWNVTWEAKAVDEEGNEPAWITLYPSTTYVNVAVADNTVHEVRSAWVVFTTDWEEKPEVRVKVTQEAAKEYNSTLTGDVALDGVLNAGIAEINPWQVWENETEATKTNAWTIHLYDNTELESLGGSNFNGKGSVLKLIISTDRVEFNEENVYYIDEGTYTVGEAPTNAANRVAGVVYAGVLSTSPFNKFPNSYYIEFDGDNVTVNTAPISGGTVEVSRDGDNYTFDINLTDDYGWSIAGTYTGTIDLNVLGNMTDNPKVGK